MAATTEKNFDLVTQYRMEAITAHIRDIVSEYFQIASKPSFSLTDEEIARESAYRSVLNERRQEVLILSQRTRGERLRFCEVQFVKTYLSDTTLKKKPDYPRILKPQHANLGETLFDYLENFLVPMAMMDHEFPDEESLRADFRVTLNSQLELKEQEGYRGAHLIEEVCFSMLKKYHAQYFGGLFDGLVQNFEDHLDTIIVNQPK